MYAMKVIRRYAVEATPILLFIAACMSMVYAAQEQTIEVFEANEAQASATAATTATDSTDYYLQRNWHCSVTGGVVSDDNLVYACDFFHFCDYTRALSNSDDVQQWVHAVLRNCANVEKDMDNAATEPDSDNVDTDDVIHHARDAVVSTAIVWESMLDDPTCMTLIMAILSLALVLYTALAFAFYRFERPRFIHEDIESLDLALCFHLNLAFKHRAFLYIKIGCGLFVLSMAAFGISSAAFPAIILRTIVLELIIALKSLFDLFQPADKCSFTYSDYQQKFLKDFKNANDTARATLIQSSGVRVLEAIAQQTSVEIPQAALA